MPAGIGLNSSPLQGRNPSGQRGALDRPVGASSIEMAVGSPGRCPGLSQCAALRLKNAALALRASCRKRCGDLVHEAYGMTPDEVALLWQTAPPRMPFYP